MSTTAPGSEQTPVQDQPAQTPPPAVAPAQVAPAGNGPWSSDLATLFPDEATRTQVDGFIRDKVQPYTTNLEQEVASSRDAANLWKALNDDPLSTYISMTNEMFGEQAGEQVLDTLQRAMAGDPQAQAQVQQDAQQVQDAAQQNGQLDPRVAQAVQFVEQQQQATAHAQNMEATIAANPDLDSELLQENIYPFLLAENNNYQAAVAKYRDFVARFGQPASAQQVDPNTPDPAVAPPTVGGEGQAGTPPLRPAKQTLDEAFADFGRELIAGREAPPVGPA